MQSQARESHSGVFHQMVSKDLVNFWEKEVQLEATVSAEALGQEQVHCVRYGALKSITMTLGLILSELRSP